MKDNISKILLKEKAVKISLDSPFTWTSGIKSPIYCDNRILISSVKSREKILDKFEELIKQKKIDFDVIAGTATAGIPWASFLAHKLKVPMVYVRTKAKKHGAKKQVEGKVNKNLKILIVEDLFSTGMSSIDSAEACRKELNGEISAVISIFSYNLEKMKENFKTANLKYFSLSNFSNLIDILDIDIDKKNLLKEFAINPKDWWSSIKNDL